MRKRSLAVAPALPTAALAISHSSVKPARKNTEVEALPKPGKMHDELLKEVILAARAVFQTGVARAPGQSAAASLASYEATGRHRASGDQKRGGTCTPEKDCQRSKSVSQTVSENRGEAV